ncbi:MAG: hypothetical protein ACPGJV_14260 [Bacteriovoracaceae bacterium]
MTKEYYCPSFMKENVFEIDLSLGAKKRDRVWKRLQLRETFAKGQVPPYRVEFESGKNEGPFQEGERNIHHGPLLSVHGEIGKITDEYRSLHYYYGSYVLTFNIIRPTLLEFFKTETGIKMKLHTYIRPWFIPFWKMGNWFFWKQFGLSLKLIF